MKQNQKRNRLRLRIALMIAILLAACVFPGAALAYTTDRYDIDVILFIQQFQNFLVSGLCSELRHLIISVF